MSELNDLIKEIKESTKQVAINKTDEVRVMTCMLNDKDFKYQKYEKNIGRVGEVCPHDTAVQLASNIIFDATRLEKKNCDYLASQLQFTKKEAIAILELNKEFIDVYMSTGRKMNLIQNEKTEANIYTKDMGSAKKSVPDKETGTVKSIKTSPYVKLSSQSTCPNYNKK